MNELKIFSNDEFGQIRTLDKDGMPWFVGKDVAEILGYKNPNEAIADHIDSDDKLNSKTLLSSRENKLNNETVLSLGQRGGWLINESGLYSLILSSKLPKAKEFKRWVTSEVLPSIRKYGAYMMPEVAKQIIEDPEYAKHIAGLLYEDKIRKLLTTTETYKADTDYSKWTNNSVTPLMDKLGLYHPTITRTELLKASYRALKAYEKFDVYAERDKFVFEQLRIVAENNIDVTGLDFNVPFLYLIYCDTEMRIKYSQMLIDFIIADQEAGKVIGQPA